VFEEWNAQLENQNKIVFFLSFEIEKLFGGRRKEGRRRRKKSGRNALTDVGEADGR
jgi:hypothetical protein